MINPCTSIIIIVIIVIIIIHAKFQICKDKTFNWGPARGSVFEPLLFGLYVFMLGILKKL